jgi:hypothetical protein
MGAETTKTNMPRGREIVFTGQQKEGEFHTYIDLCDEVALYFAPEQETLLEITEGSEVLQPIISTGILANQRLQSGLYSNSMAMGKGDIKDSDPKMMEMPLVSDGYAEVSKTTHHHIAQSTFPQRFYEWLSDFVPFGAGCMYLQWNRDTKRHEYKVFPVGKCFPEFDPDGYLCAMYRKYQYTAEQSVEAFGYNECPKVVRKAYDTRDATSKFDYWHCMRKNRKYDENSTHWSKMRYESVHVHAQSGKICRDAGSRRMRYNYQRFYTKHGERNGRSPAMQCLPVIRTLMKTVSDHIDGTELAIGPPMWLPDRDAVDNAILESFSVNYADLSKGNPWVYNPDARALQLSAEFIEWLREEINQLFYVDLFTMLEQHKAGAKTAYEISQLVAERTQAIAPIANALGDFFRWLYYNIAIDLIEEGLVEAPVSNFNSMTATYTSRLDIRLNEIQNTATMEAVMQSAELVQAVKSSPEVEAVVDIIKAVIAIFESHNVDPDVVRNEVEARDELADIYEGIQQAQMQEQMGNMMGRADPLKAPEEGSAVADMVEESAGGMVGI